MDNINHVTAAVIRRCAEKKVSVTETLAAFVARARVLEAPQLYHMDKKLTDEDISELIQVRSTLYRREMQCLTPLRVDLRRAVMRARLAITQDYSASSQL